MLEIESGQKSRDCQGPSRRQLLQVGALGIGGLTLANLLAMRAVAANAGVRAKDTSVVLLFLTGGPSQIETFDPKPNAPVGFRSLTGSTQTSLPGVSVGGTFRKLATLADRLAFVRSFTHNETDHTRAVEQVIRGGNSLQHASLGAVTARLRGTSHFTSGMPTHVFLEASEIDRQFERERLRLLGAAGAGELGGGYGPFQAGGQDEVRKDMLLRISAGRLQDRLHLHKKLDRLNRHTDASNDMEDLDRFEQQALQLVLGKSRGAFDLSREDRRVVERYDTSGHMTGLTRDRPSTLGHQLLLARRLCEAGCGFITIHNPGWDMHGGPTQFNLIDGLQKLGGPVDHAVSAFLEDVAARGLSDKILLIITGEFGRTPRVNNNGGRDHWPMLSTLAFAGGGLKMGQVIGDSTSKGEEPRSNPITLDHLLGTVLQVLFDLPALRRQTGLPREISALIARSRIIPQL